MLRTFARILGIIVALVAIVGLFVEGDHLLGFMNVDLAQDFLRIIIAAALLIVGFAPNVSFGTVRAVVGVIGALYVVLGLLAVADRTLFGLLPTGSTLFDIVIHLILGLGALLLVFLPDRAMEGSDARSSTSRS